MSQESDLFQKEPIKKVKEKKPRQLNNHQKIIQRFVTVDFSSKARGFWPHQMKLAGQLINKYGIDFLLWCPKPNGYKVNNLLWFLTIEGQHYLSDQLLIHSKQDAKLFEKEPEIVLENDKIGEDIIIERKPRTLKEFLNYGKTIYPSTTSGPKQTDQTSIGDHAGETPD